MKKILFILVSALMLSSAFGVRECVYDPRGFTFHCSNNMPGTKISPGGEGEITIVCCFTGRQYLNSTKEETITAKAVGSWVRSRQLPDGSWEKINQTYPASAFITKIDYPNKSRGFHSFPVTIHYKLPKDSPLYKPGAVIPSRVDIMVHKEGSVTLNNMVLPQIRIPENWKRNSPEQVILGAVAGGSVLGALIFVRKKRKKKKMEKAKEL